MRSDPYSAEYTEEELANLPQTTQIFDPPKLKFKQHEWRQEGYMISDNCSPARPDCMNVGIPIPNGKMLVKRDGRYDLVPESDVVSR